MRKARRKARPSAALVTFFERGDILRRDLEIVAPCCFCPVKRLIRHFQKRIAVKSVLHLTKRDPRAGGHGKRTLAEHEIRAHRGDDFLGDAKAVLSAGERFEDDYEFVAAQARGGVGVPYAGRGARKTP